MAYAESVSLLEVLCYMQQHSTLLICFILLGGLSKLSITKTGPAKDIIYSVSDEHMNDLYLNLHTGVNHLILSFTVSLHIQIISFTDSYIFNKHIKC